MNTDEFIRAKDKVIVILKKILSSDIGNEICYETIQSSFNEKHIGSTITLEINDLVVAKLSEDWNKKQPNAHKLLESKTATLVIYYGNVDGLSGGYPQQIQITDKGAFITWQVESAEYLTSIVTSLNQYKAISIKLDLDVDDEFFAIHGKLYNSAINKISITFN